MAARKIKKKKNNKIMKTQEENARRWKKIHLSYIRDSMYSDIHIQCTIYYVQRKPPATANNKLQMCANNQSPVIFHLISLPSLCISAYIFLDLYTRIKRNFVNYILRKMK